MKKTKKWLALFAAQVLVVGTLAGCGSANNTSSGSGKEDSGKPMEISIAHWDIEKGLAGGANDKVLKTIEDKFNVKFVPMNVTWDDYVQKIQLWAASDSLPDIFSVDAIGTSFYHTWISQGVVKGLPADLSKYENLNEYVKADDIEALKIDGQLYCIPRKTYPNNTWNAIDRTVAYRWDLAQAAGVTKEPETWEEFEDMMLKIIKADPEGKKIAGLTTTATSLLDGLFFTYSLPLAMSDGSGSDYKWVEKDGQYIPAYFAGDAVATFQLARDLYKSGAIEPDIALTKLQQAQDKFLQGQSVAILRPGGPETLYDYAGKFWGDIYEGRDVFEDVKILKLLPGQDGNKYYPVFRTSWSESYISSKVKDDKLDRILQIYDYMISDEGSNLIDYGIEGEDFEIVDGKVVLKVDNISDKYSSSSVLNTIAQWTKSVWNENVPARTPEGYRELSFDKYNEAVEEGTLPEFDMRYTYLSTPLKDKFVIKPAEDLLNIMMGSEPVEKMYKDLLDKYEQQGLSAMIKEVNDVAKEKGWQ
ncbi:MAG: extracellular solute-binding protein [Cellulosilyticaceae bacterium]